MPYPAFFNTRILGISLYCYNVHCVLFTLLPVPYTTSLGTRQGLGGANPLFSPIKYVYGENHMIFGRHVDQKCYYEAKTKCSMVWASFTSVSITMLILIVMLLDAITKCSTLSLNANT